MPDALPIDALIRQFQGRLEQQEAAAAQALVASYERMMRRLQAQQDALAMEVAAMRAGGAEPTAAQVARLARFRTLTSSIKREMDGYAAILGDQVQAVQPGAVQLGLSDAEALVLEQYPPEVAAVLRAQFTRFPADAIEAMVGALQADSPLQRLVLQSFGTEAATGIGEALARALASGKGPGVVARELARAWGVPLTRALLISRAEYQRAYRAATQASYKANPGVVKGWQWVSARDKRTCMSCLAMHGTLHSMDEKLDDHPNGRCMMVPVTATWAELGFEGIPDRGTGVMPGDGEVWFRGLSESDQQGMMGKAKYEAWRDGAFRFQDLAHEVYDTDWGRMFREATLKELINGK